MPQQALSAGRVVNLCEQNANADSLKDILNDNGTHGYDFLVINLSHPRCCLDLNQLRSQVLEASGDAGDLVPTNIIKQNLPPLTIADITLTSHEWSRVVVGKPSKWIDPDSTDPYIRHISEQALKEELSYFAYLSIPAVVISLRRAENPNLARIIQQILGSSTSSSYAIWIEVPMVAPGSSDVVNGDGAYAARNAPGSSTDPPAVLSANEQNQTNETAANANDTWHWFFEFRRACNSHRRISLLLEVTADLPESPTEIARWKGEPLAAIKFDTHTFLTNNSGFPVLSKAHQAVAKEFFRLNIQCLVDGPKLHVRRPHQSNDGADGASPVDATCLYYAYLNNLWKNKYSGNQTAEWVSGYEDYLQLPLQPLGDHLESEVYEAFERDPIKYELYRQAFGEAIDYKIQNAPSDRVFVIMVLGAGRGPLVTGAYEVLKQKNVKFKLYAVEKNPCALVTLKHKQATEWNNEVEVVFSDMRNFKPEEKADVIISELLGSFGDNELSPECLDGALHLMKPDCISIPSSYRSFIAPVHSPKLMNEVRSAAQKEYKQAVGFESPYVVRVFNQFEIDGAKELFRFEHPNWQQNSNERYKELSFFARDSCEMMGVVGYFYATLYGQISLSTVPNYETPRLCSWFPILFSLRDPVYVEKGQKIRVRFWRCRNEHQVWYEWQLAEPVVTPIMNPNGSSYAIRLV